MNFEGLCNSRRTRLLVDEIRLERCREAPEHFVPEWIRMVQNRFRFLSGSKLLDNPAHVRVLQ